MVRAAHFHIVGSHFEVQDQVKNVGMYGSTSLVSGLRLRRGYQSWGFGTLKKVENAFELLNVLTFLNLSYRWFIWDILPVWDRFLHFKK